MGTKTIELVLKLGRKMGASDKEISEIILEELQGNHSVEESENWSVVLEKSMQPSTTEPEQIEDDPVKKNPLVAMNFGLTREKVDKFLKDYKIAPGFKIPCFELINKIIGYVPKEPAGKRACTNFLIGIPGIAYLMHGDSIKTKSTQWGQSSILEIGALAINNPELPLEGEGK
jgi:hypothetical protein